MHQNRVTRGPFCTNSASSLGAFLEATDVDIVKTQLGIAGWVGGWVLSPLGLLQNSCFTTSRSNFVPQL